MITNFHFGSNKEEALYKTMIGWSETPKLKLKTAFGPNNPVNASSFSIGEKRDSVNSLSQARGSFVKHGVDSKQFKTVKESSKQLEQESKGTHFELGHFEGNKASVNARDFGYKEQKSTSAMER